MPDLVIFSLLYSVMEKSPPKEHPSPSRSFDWEFHRTASLMDATDLREEGLMPSHRLRAEATVVCRHGGRNVRRLSHGAHSRGAERAESLCSVCFLSALVLSPVPQPMGQRQPATVQVSRHSLVKPP